jgi:SAM-dependent methyltransferase
MDEYTASTYGDRIAEVYDTFYVTQGLATSEPDDAVEFLIGLAGEGPALELAIGTGRMALPLAARGLQIHGIDASERMVAKLREKPGGDAIQVTMGDFADVAVDGEYALIFVVFNTFFALLTQDDQVRCMQNAARRLRPDGCFVIEAFVPDVSRFDRHQRTSAGRVGVDEVIIDVAEHDPEHQRVDSMHVLIRDGRVQTYPVRLRYAWPAELDLMARLAGLRLRERWVGWKREPFDGRSGAHVSVYEPSG